MAQALGAESGGAHTSGAEGVAQAGGIDADVGDAVVEGVTVLARGAVAIGRALAADESCARVRLTFYRCAAALAVVLERFAGAVDGWNHVQRAVLACAAVGLFVTLGADRGVTVPRGAFEVVDADATVALAVNAATGAGRWIQGAELRAAAIGLRVTVDAEAEVAIPALAHVVAPTDRAILQVAAADAEIGVAVLGFFTVVVIDAVEADEEPPAGSAFTVGVAEAPIYVVVAAALIRHIVADERERPARGVVEVKEHDLHRGELCTLQAVPCAARQAPTCSASRYVA